MNNDQLEERDLMMAPGKIMFFSWLNNLFLKKQAHFNEDNYNIIELHSLPSSWFCIGRNNEDKSPFIGIQEHMVPWFLETPWKKAFIVVDENKLYLTCGDEESGDFTLGIKVRKKRLKVLWSKETRRHLDFRVIKVKSQSDISVSEKSYRRAPLGVVKSIENVVAQSDFVFEDKSDALEDEIRERYNEKYGQANTKIDEDFDE